MTEEESRVLRDEAADRTARKFKTMVHDAISNGKVYSSDVSALCRRIQQVQKYDDALIKSIKEDKGGG